MLRLAACQINRFVADSCLAPLFHAEYRRMRVMRALFLRCVRPRLLLAAKPPGRLDPDDPLAIPFCIGEREPDD
jgi:ABC-type ATPase involved in cell division